MTLYNIDSKNESNMLKSMAVQKPETSNPSIQLLAMSTSTALITNKNRPKVKMVTGKVNTTRTGFKKVNKIPIKTATQIAVV